MANLTQHLTSISPELRSGPSPGRRLVALVLCSMLVLASVFPGVALAGEADSEGVGTVPEVEVPVPPTLILAAKKRAWKKCPRLLVVKKARSKSNPKWISQRPRRGSHQRHRDADRSGTAPSSSGSRARHHCP